MHWVVSGESVKTNSAHFQRIHHSFEREKKKLFPATAAEYHVSKYANDEPYEMLNRTECCERQQKGANEKRDHKCVILYANHIFNGFMNVSNCNVLKNMLTRY